MKLFIIGNGFDIGHGLPTRYWDFRTYLENIYPAFLRDFEDHYYIYPNMSKNEKADLLWNQLETNLANINDDVIIENGVAIDMNLESGDVGIEDTLYEYFSAEYNYINRLSKYLKQWVRTIRIRDIQKKTTLITNESFYITFNYTAVLERIYQISPANILHIHGSLREYDIDPVLGHGNLERIRQIKAKKEDAVNNFDEKLSGICKVVEDYYTVTLKDVKKYAVRISQIADKDIDEVSVIGHSLAGVDMFYFKQIDIMTKNRVIWKVYFHCPEKKDILKMNLLSSGIDEHRIDLIPTSEFYNFGVL